jgi:hypothetical protein
MGLPESGIRIGAPDVGSELRRGGTEINFGCLEEQFHLKVFIGNALPLISIVYTGDLWRWQWNSGVVEWTYVSGPQNTNQHGIYGTSCNGHSYFFLNF